MVIYGIRARPCPPARVLGPEGLGPEMMRKKFSSSSGLNMPFLHP